MNAADCLQNAEDEYLATDEQREKRQLHMQLRWQVEATNELIQSLEYRMRMLDMNTEFTIQSINDLGQRSAMISPKHFASAGSGL